jgi:flagellar basal-body rod modification protein FlgD
MTASPLTATPAASPSATSQAPASSPPENPKGVLGQNDFLKLMIAQLQAQNPLEPGNSNEFVNELAMMTQTEQTTNVANATELSGAVQLIGRTVSYEGASGTATGKVQSVQSDASGTTVTVEGVSGITLSSITEVN